MTIRFFFPYRSPSGVCSAFARMAQEVAARGGNKVAILDYPDGYLRRSLRPDNQVTLEDFEDGQRVKIPEGDVLVLQASSPSCLRREFTFDPDARLVFWQLHPHNFIPNLFPLVPNGAWLAKRPALYRTLLTTFHGAKRRRVIAFVNLLARRRALYFYEQPSLRMTEQLLGFTVPDPILLPVPVPVPDAPIRRARLSPDSLQVAWVGRLYDFKIHILTHTLRRFSDFARQQQTSITFHVIGDGPERGRLDALKLEHRYFKLQRIGDLEPKSLPGYLASKVDLVTAMGTSAMEGALIGLPAILLDLSYGPVEPGYQFRWLCDTQGFDLGHTVTGEDCDPARDVLPGMMEVVRRDYAALGRKCFDYCMQNHSLLRIGDRLLELVQSSSLRFRDLPGGLCRKSLPRRLYERHWRHA